MKTTSVKKYDGLEIAIIGVSAQFPGSNNYQEFWRNLCAGNESLQFLTNDELKERGIDSALLENSSFVKTAGGVLSDKDTFDNSFFGYTVEEATLMDPQIRLFHKHCWNALDDAGYTSAIDKKKIGLFAGASGNTNWKIHLYKQSANSNVDPFYLSMISTPNFMSSLVAYKLNLRGPVFYVDSACSTSMGAVHLACRSLLTRECVLALAGGISIQTVKKQGYKYYEGRISSNDGHCRTFDKEATGTAVGEGAGVLVLKRLSEAMKDGDNIYAIIRATAVNNDGEQKVGYTAPSVKGQAECISIAMKLANVTPESISYVEAHGTGTRLGDPIEIEALNLAFNHNREHSCAVGSVKTNIGHLDTAAGVAGLIKTALCLQHRMLVPSLHFREANPEIDFAGGPFSVNTELRHWDSPGGGPLRAGVSSFGIGGTNAHAVLEEAPQRAASDAGRGHDLLTVSAKTSGSVERYLSSLRVFLEGSPDVNVSDLAYSLQVGRKEFPYRSTLSYSGYGDLLEQLSGTAVIEKSPSRRPGVVFLFPGQGSQYAGMSRGLYEAEPFFRTEMDAGFAFLEGLTGKDFKAVLFGGGDVLNNTTFSQPLLFLVEYSLSRLLISVGITPDYMIGHSIGEYVAACLSGVFSFEDGLRLVIRRGELMGSVAPGQMLSVPLSASEAAALATEGISLAAVNGPEQTVLSGEVAAMSALKSRLEASGVPYVQLHTSHAFHSSMQEGILGDFRSVVEGVELHSPGIPFLSNLSGGLVSAEEACSADYWADHLRRTVQFSKGIDRLLSLGGEQLFIEVGPGHSLGSLLKQHRTGDAAVYQGLLPGAKVQADAHSFFLAGLGSLWRHGASINWEAYHAGSTRLRIPLPTYSFEPLRYPVEVDPFSGGLLSVLGQGGSGSLGDWVYHPLWKRGLPSVPEGVSRNFLLVDCGGAFGAGLAGALEGLGHRVLHMGSGSEEKAVTGFASPADYRELLMGVSSSGFTVTDIVYCAGLESGAGAETLYLSLSGLVQGLVGLGMMKGLRISVLTEGLHRVHGTEKGSVEASVLLGLVNVLPQEYPVSSLNIDILTGEGGITGHLAAELCAAWPRAERTVALRGGYRWLCDYRPHASAVSPSGTVLRKGGLYLVTGGLGNVGNVLSRYLQDHYGAGLVLTGRRPFSSLGEAALARYGDLSSGAGHCSYHAVDVSDADSLLLLVEEIASTIGHIDGIIHTAGVTDEHYFELSGEITEGSTDVLFSAKVDGIRVLEEVFRHRGADFVWATSSLSSVLGGLGFSGYASANSYMDHFIAGLQGGSTRWRSVCLGGMAFSREQIGREQGNRRATLKPEELGRLFEWSLGDTGSAVLVQTVEPLPARLHRVYEVEKGAYLDQELPGSAEAVRVERPALGSAYVAPVTETEERLTGIFEQFFGINAIGTADNFFELGGDSLKGMMLLKRVKNEFNVNITLTDLLMRNTIADMAIRIDEMLWLNTDVKKENEIVI